MTNPLNWFEANQFSNSDGHPYSVILVRFDNVGGVTNQAFPYPDLPARGEKIFHVPATLGRRELGNGRRRNVYRIDGAWGHVVGNVTENHTVSQAIWQVIA